MPTAEELAILKSTSNTGINFDQYENIPVDVLPAVFEPLERFSDAKLGDALQKVIEHIGNDFRYKSATIFCLTWLFRLY